MDYEDYLDYRDDPEAFDEWHAPDNQATHTCEECGCKFKGHASRGKLSFCESCADKRERC